MKRLQLLFAVLLTFCLQIAKGQEIETVKLLDNGYDYRARIGEFATLNQQLYFTILSDTGTTLWRYDDSIGEPEMIGSWLVQNGEKLQCMRLTPYKNKLIFIASDPLHGVELWSSDGTRSGTQLLKDIRPNVYSWSAFAMDSKLNFFREYNGKLYLLASNDYHKDSDLWKTDGTDTGTKAVFDVSRMYAGAYSARMLELLNGKLYYGSYGGGLYSCYGLLEAGGLISPEVAPSNCFATINKLYFTLYDSYKNGPSGLAVTDGTAAGTVALDSNITITNDCISIGQTIYFIGSSRQGVKGLYRSNGTKGGTSLIRDSLNVFTYHFTTTISNQFAYLTVLNHKFYFFDNNGFWVSDGTASGTKMLRPFRMQGVLSAGESLTLLEAHGRLYFQALDSGKVDLYTSDGTAEGTHKISPPFPNNGQGRVISQPMTVYHGRLYFGGYYSEQGENTLYRVTLPPEDTIPKPWATGLTIFPNPSTGSITIRPTVTQGFSSCMIYDITGRQVWSQALPDAPWKEYTLELEGLAGGAYIVQLNGLDETLRTRVLIVR